MKGRQAVLGQRDGRKAAALLVDGVLDDLLIDPPDDRPIPGAIYRAVPGRPLKGNGGLFVNLPGGAAGFLRQTRGVSTGGPLLVQVSSHAEPDKAVPVTTRLTIKGRAAIVTPGAPGVNVSRRVRDAETRDALLAIADSDTLPEDTGMILRSAAAGVDPADVAEEIRTLSAVATRILSDRGAEPELLLAADDAHAEAWREWEAEAVEHGDDAFDRLGVTDLIAPHLSPLVKLPGGASLYIEPTRALVAVDVNTGPDGSPAAGLKADLAAARALPRALRLRGLGGQIAIDMAPAPKKDRRQIETALRAAFRTDPVETVLAGWTPLGHFELQRKRARLPLSEVSS